MTRIRLTAPRLIVAVWTVVVIVDAVTYIDHNINLPDAEGYEREWRMQVLFFLYARMPLLTIGLAVALVLARITKSWRQ